MQKISCVLVLWFFSQIHVLASAKTWNGSAGDGLWTNPVNWNNHALPLPSDDVLLDNSEIPVNYTVQLPNTAVTVRTLIIRPTTGQTIQLVLPSSNLSQPAFTLTGPGYGLIIENGGIFQNASGLAGGESLVVGDSIRINNGGKYIHHTRASHANNIVRLLSTVQGTETGIFEFDVPRASYTVSASNRSFGSLFFSSVASGGSVNYTCSGSNLLTVNGSLRIDEGVRFSVDLSGPNGNIRVKGDYIQNGGVFNIASGAGNATRVSIGGNLIQSSTGVIIETNTGLPSIELNGSSLQVVSMAGAIQNSISFRMNNHEGAILVFPLELPYKLELLQGKITTSNASLLTLKPGCSIVVDSSATNTSYIDGPLRKEGLSATPFFLFPVGKNPVLRWLELKQATGNFTVEYVRKNPRLLANEYGTGIDHISSLEYWVLRADPDPLAAANIELSFLDPGSGGVTDLASLRVAQLSNSNWIDEGQDGTTGSFGVAGSVVSTFQDGLIGEGYFALASSVNLENPLPVKLIDFSAGLENHEALLRWQIDPGHNADYFDILEGGNGEDFSMVGKLNASASQTSYQFVRPVWKIGLNYFRLRVHEKTGISYLSRIIPVRLDSDEGDVLSINPSVVNGNATMIFRSKERNRLSCLLVGMNGISIKAYAFLLEPGTNSFSLDFSGLSSGTYQLIGRGRDGKYFHARFVKK